MRLQNRALCGLAFLGATFPTSRLIALHKERAPGGFPGGAVVESRPANAGDTGSSPGLGRSHMPRSD